MLPLLRCVLVFSIIFLAGCRPGVAWLPDSSGLVFIGGKDGKQLLHLDVASGKCKVILDDAKANMLWPAVSPDGKSIALAHLSGMGVGPSSLRVRLVNLEGKEITAFGPFEVRDRAEANSPHGLGTLRGLPQLFWRPQGDKILIHADMAAVVLDVKAGKFKKTEARWRGLPEAAIPVVFGPTPITPDGNAFLVWNWKGDEQVPYALMDWEGKLQTLKPAKGSERFFKEMDAETKDSDNQWGIGMFTPASFGGHWLGDRARMRWANVDLHVDAKEKTMSGTLVKQAKVDGKPLDFEYGLTNAVVQFVRLAVPETQQALLMPYRVRVDVQTKTRRTLIEKADEVVIIPSPDRKLLAMRCAIPLKDGVKLSRDDYRDRILVVNSQGEVVADFAGPTLERWLPGDKKVARKDEEKIQGAWKIVRYVERGAGSAKDELDFMEVLFKGDTFEIKHPGGAGKKGTFKLDPSKKPGHIDLFGGGEKKPAPGIYVFDGKTLKICLPPGPDILKGIRPTEFTSTRENGYALMVLEPKKTP